MSNAILTLNAGSSSIKFALFQTGAAPGLTRLLHGQIEGIGVAPHFIAQNQKGDLLTEKRWPTGEHQTHETLLSDLLDWIDHHLGGEAIIAAGHRVVHGGAAYARPMPLTDALLGELEKLIPLAPLHQPHNISPIRAIAALRPALRQVACFDTAFHRAMPPIATRFALPREYENQGVRRYGFHGLSYDYIAQRLQTIAPDLSKGRVIVAHLGNGASLCAMHNSRSVDTTMGFTALDGLVMGTRCGTIDPGVVLYLQQMQGLNAEQIEDILYKKSGLLGISGISSDMRALLESQDERARDAVDLFVFHIARHTGALASSLGGLDGFVFTAGIGEHAAQIRAAVCRRLSWLGAVLDEEANIRGDMRISTPESRVEIMVIPTDEEAMIARQTLDTINAPQ